jgi:lipopolysaccharide biosynthesis glycosyltransferase
LNNIEELYNQKLNNFPLGAIKDQYENRILKNFFYSGLNSYFNAGVMLIDLKKWRKVKITKKSLEFIKEHKKDLKLHDQDVLNGLFKNNWQSLNKKFNFSAKNKSIPSNVVILHYLTKEKPWSYLYEYKNKKYYWKYLKLSPWPDFKYLDKNLNNISKKINKKIAKKAKNFLRPLIPLRIIKKIKKLKKK